MSNTDPTGFKYYFPWVHPKDWSYPAPNHSQGVLDGLQTTINIVSNHTHTLIYLHRPAPPLPELGLYHDDIPDQTWGEQKIHPADDIQYPAIKLLSDYFRKTESEDPNLTHFSLYVNPRDLSIPLHLRRVVVPAGTPICLNSRKTSIGVKKGTAMDEDSTFLCYPFCWLHPVEKKIDWKKVIKQGILIPIPPETGIPQTIYTLPDLD